MVTIYKVLHTVLFYAGFLAILVLAIVIGHFGRKDLEFVIFAVALAPYLALMVVESMVNRRNKRIGLLREQASAAAANLPGKLHSLQASAAYHHDAHTVWSLIRPAESATFLSDVQRAFTVPGTPQGVGEQQCFIGRDGSVSIVEVIGEESPRWATTRPITEDTYNRRYTYRLEPTTTGCTLTVGVIMELPPNAAFAADPNEWWESHSRIYLDRIHEVLSGRKN
ncbi:hypothetical protein [Pseudarthrobacter defluvii]|uniref:hypothetical protein n=1 Tax=Pseudarthrobacter defluvii TaxID=410837 RepID=UPI00257629B3|nr:hypothetical protein [Pseudarthrobacter defluvii]WJH25399.1 hypothetical protein JCQ34_04760 [Pseudarthrobacter defluvii]